MSVRQLDISLISTAGASDGQALVYNAASGTVNFGTAGGGGVSVYANTSLLPNTGVSVGSQAYVEDVDRLYLYTSLNAWYQITTTNSPPNAISNYLSAYYLASNGAPTVISFVSSDPELVPLSWSYAVSNGVLGNTTVTHSANVFTVTPSTSTSDEGNFTLTVTATDGAYSVNANVLFYLSFVEGWNVANATLVGVANVSYSVASQESNPQGVQFSSNGLAMYVVGTTGDDINQYTLDSPWNLDTVTFVTQYTFTANATANNMQNPYCFQFSPDGANLYLSCGTIAGGGGEPQIVQLSLPTPNSLATINLSANNIAPRSVSAEETSPTEVYLRDDGTRMYVLGSTGDDVNEYQLSRAWDPSSATFTGSFLVSAKDTAPQGLYFTSSGNAFFIVGTSSDAVHRYDMSTPWSVNSAVFTSSFPVANQETVPNAVEFKPEGDRMYVMGATGDDVNEYSLSTPWDITTATFVQLKSVSAQATDPNGFRFSSDGTKAYMNGTFYRVHYYTLSEAWNVATMTFQYSWDPIYETEATLNGLAFSPDGDYLYLTGSGSDEVTPFYLRTPWDLNTATLPGRLINKNYFTDTRTYFRIGSNGEKVYLTNQTQDSILEFTLNTTWDISSATYSNTFSVTLDTLTPTGIDLNEEGTEITIGDGSRFYTYKMTTPWDLTTVYRPQTIALTEANPQDFYLRSDGSKLYVVGTTLDAVIQYDLSTPWDLDTASLVGSFSVGTQEGTPTGLTFNGSGTRMYVVGNSGKYIYEYTLGTPWDISTSSYLRPLSLGQIFETTIDFIDFSPNGHWLYLGITGLYIDNYYLSEAYDITSVQYKTRYYYDELLGFSTAYGVSFNALGTEAYLLERNPSTPRIWKVTLSTPWDLASSYGQRDIYNIPSGSVVFGETRGLQLSSNGQYAYITSADRDILVRFELTVPYDFSTLHHPYISQILNYASASIFYYDVTRQANSTLLFTVNTNDDTILRLPTSSQNLGFSFGSNAISWYRTESTTSAIGTASIEDLLFKPDGTRMYTVDSGTDTIFEFTLQIPWDLTTLTLTRQLYVNIPEGDPRGIEFSSDGQYLYVVGLAADTVFQYKLPTPWSLQLPVLIGSYSVSAQELNPASIVFSPDGIYMYVMGTNGDDINQYTLSTPWDVTTASFTRVQSVAAQDNTPYNLVFKPDGSRLYVRGGANRRVYEYNLSTPWDVSTLSFTRQLQLPSSWSTNGGIALNYNGTRLYVGETTTQTIRTYELGS